MVSGVHLGIPIRLWALCWLSSISSIMAFWVWSHRFNLTSRRLGLTGLGLVLMTIPVYAAAGLRWLSRRGCLTWSPPRVTRRVRTACGRSGLT